MSSQKLKVKKQCLVEKEKFKSFIFWTFCGRRENFFCSGVKEVNVSLLTKRAVVRFDPNIISVDDICEEIDDVGFDAAYVLEFYKIFSIGKNHKNC